MLYTVYVNVQLINFHVSVLLFYVVFFLCTLCSFSCVIDAINPLHRLLIFFQAA